MIAIIASNVDLWILQSQRALAGRRRFALLFGVYIFFRALRAARDQVQGDLSESSGEKPRLSNGNVTIVGTNGSAIRLISLPKLFQSSSAWPMLYFSIFNKGFQRSISDFVTPK